MRKHYLFKFHLDLSCRPVSSCLRGPWICSADLFLARVHVLAFLCQKWARKKTFSLTRVKARGRRTVLLGQWDDCVRSPLTNERTEWSDNVTNLWSSGWVQQRPARANQQLLFVELHLKLEMRFVQWELRKWGDNRKYWIASGELGPKVVFFLTVFRLIGQFRFN